MRTSRSSVRAAAVAGVLGAGCIAGPAGCDRSPRITPAPAPTTPFQAGTPAPPAKGGNQFPFPGVKITNRIPVALLRGDHSGLEATGEGHHNWITDGEVELPVARLADRSVDQARRVEDLLVSMDVVIVLIDVSSRSEFGFTTDRMNALIAAGKGNEPVHLIDTDGNRYMPVGFVYKDVEKVRVRYTPGRPIATYNELPRLVRGRQDQQLTLIYRITFNKAVRFLAVGDRVRAEWNPPYLLDIPQAR